MRFFTPVLMLLWGFVSFAQVQDTTLYEEIPQENQLLHIEEQQQYAAKININKASNLDLISTGLLNKQQALTILSHRKTYGKFISLYELQSISGISLDTLKQLSQQLYIPFFDYYQPKQFFKEGQHYALCRWERKLHVSKGYQENTKGLRPYAGDDYRLLYRFRSSFSNVYAAGLSLEKDAGEVWTWSPSKKQFYFDYTSAYLIVQPKKIIEQLVIGDFHFRSGHGLVFGGNFIASKNPAYWQSAWQIGQGFRAHTSSAEYGFYRGIGISTQSTGWGARAFFSRSPQDGTLRNDGSMSGINTSGLHRSSSEQEKRHTVHLTQTGGVLTYQNTNQNIIVGLEYLYSAYSVPFIREQNYYTTKNFRGQAHQIAGLDVQYHYAGGMVFNELALSSGGGRSSYGGILHNLSKQNTWMLQYWSSNATFESIQGNIPSFSTRMASETGIYQALLFHLTPKLSTAVGFSMYANSSPQQGKKGPSYGQEWINRFTYQWRKKVSFTIQCRKVEPEEMNDTHTFRPQPRYYLMGDLLHQEDRCWQFHSRVQWGIFDLSQHEESYCLSQSIGYRLHRCRFNTQLSIFDTPSWDSRLYAYEPDVPMAFSIPALSGNGIRWSLVATVKPLINTELSLKIAHVMYYNAKTIGSGYDEVEGNQQTEIKVQARLFL
jgi:hypothetical protein